ncbi:MAG: FHA domain-containing protein [Chloroflexi bacterium]|nr:FHA domain-containing protein [Chloroflexota bacterium]MBK6711226.1 FHA domain-containing protein [Chloroflexota bacterium]MBK7176228.1 FHA domain-containing protein [Chloroflexota bacterium]MBK7915895.1 FHA domain-containing protein [Chloroflexota bacterium]MBP6803660.1 FHA domain-containing protein [Chloroflexota bacterium]
MNQAVARLVVRRGPTPNQTFDLIQEKIIIGRSSGNEIAITDPEISRKHAQLIRQDAGYALEDLGSTNGSFINDRRVVGLTPLHHGDVIDLGEAISLVYVVGGLEDDSTMLEGGGSLAEVDTVPEGLQIPVYTPPAFVADPRQAAPNPVSDMAGGSSCRQRVLLGCGGLVLLMFFCVATVYFLDAYEQGRLLYCGVLRPFWNFILGPFGFAPLCA